MVGFGKKLREVQNPEWKQYYIDYKMMKKKLKEYMRKCKEGASDAEKEQMRRQFTRVLDWQVEKIVLFLLEQQGYLAARLSALGADRSAVRDSGDPARIAEFIGAYRRVGSQLLDLLHYVEVNATGIRKILKKFDKRAAHRLTDYYVASRSNNPYSQLQQVFRHVGIGAMVGALTRSIAELKNYTASIYDEPRSFLNVEEPIIHSIKVAQERLTDSTNFLKYVAKQMLGAVKDEEGEEETGRALGEDEYIRKQYHLMSLLLNLGNTFLYMVNTYIIVPTADKYAYRLGAEPTLCGVIIGSMAVAQLLSSVYFSAWSNTSYNRPLLCSSALLLAGNLLYALAFDLRSLSLLILGRILCGLGSARAVNRRYVSDWVPLKTRLKASAGFVSASALGMAAGPALAGVLEVDRVFAGVTFDANTLPGWVMAAAWLLYMVWLLLGFKEPARRPLAANGSKFGVKSSQLAPGQVQSSPVHAKAERATINGYVAASITRPLLLDIDVDGPSPPPTHAIALPMPGSHEYSWPPSSQQSSSPSHPNTHGMALPSPPSLESGDRHGEYDRESGACESDEEERDEDDESKEPATSMVQAYKLLTTPVKVQLLIYFMLKYAMEIVLSESSVVTSFYFDWSTRAVAAFLALLGLTVLPVNYLVGSFISNIFEDRQILFASELITCLGLAICFAGPVRYTVAQYVAGSLITFVAAEVLEGVNLSLLSKVMSARLSRGTYNNGLLSTEAGTLARVLADGTITMAGYLGTQFLLNITLAPALVIGLISLILTSYSYHSLF